MLTGAAALLGLLGTAAVGYAAGLQRRHMLQWLPRYYLSPRPRAQKLSDAAPLTVFLAVCDHFEPEWGRPPREASRAKVRRWKTEYPELYGRFADSRGRPPQHTCFFPQDEYQPEYLDELAELCAAGFADVDVHLHHDHDTADGLREKLAEFRDTLAVRHGLLRRDPTTGDIVYGFIHGNWALCNSRPDGRWCGVDQELTILRETGCYADFTLPSAPSPTQTRTLNSIYYARDRAGQRKSHDRGIAAVAGQSPPPDSLLMVQGPLVPDWRRAKWGVFPRIENADLHAGRPATLDRLRLWLQAGVHVAGRPDWLFVKLHTHGCKDGNIDLWLGPEMQDFHTQLALLARAAPHLRYYYVTAWEMAQLVHQAEAGRRTPDWDAMRPQPLTCSR